MYGLSQFRSHFSLLMLLIVYNNLFTDRAKPAAGSNMRDKATVNRLKMYKSGGKTVRCAH